MMNVGMHPSFPAEPTRYRFTVAEYHRMAEAGIFGEDDRVELLDGEVIEMSPIGSPHAGHVNRLMHLMVRRLGRRAVVQVQNPVALDNHSEPEPDLSILRYRPDYYAARHPTPRDVLLVIEVADRSRSFDRRVKVPLYARARIREVWIVDLAAAVVETYRRPLRGAYREVASAARGARVAPLALPEISLRVADILG